MRWHPWLTALSGVAAGAALIAALPSALLFTSRPAAAPASAGTGERWACPMMDFIGHQPGDCPVCGMRMTRVTAGEITREQQRRMTVSLARVTEGPAIATVRAYGTVRHDERTTQVVIPRIAGRIVKRHPAALHAGTLVAAGDPVVDLFSPEVFVAQGELAAAVQLADGHAVHALTQRFQRWNLLDLATAVLKGEAPVDTVTIRSPYAGLVVLGGEGDGMNAAKLPQIGQEIMADAPLLRLVEPRAFMLVVHVPETRAHWLRSGQPASLASDDFGELPDLEARITWIAPELNPEIRAREVHLHLRDPSGRLLPGSLVNARFQATLGADLRAVDAEGTPGRFVLVPKTAVLSTGVRHVVWRVADRQADGRIRFELAPLALGPRLEDEAGNDLYVVRAGLRAGDEVATQGAFLIDSQAQLAGTPSLLFPTGAVAPGSATRPP